jgi:type IV pilus assembly protein PilA
MGAYARPVKLRQGMAVASLVLAIISLCTFGGLIVGGLTACILGIVALVKANGQPQVYGGKGMAIAGIIVAVLSLMGLPIIAAIAIPSMLRARVAANESASIGDIRTVISGEAAYQSANGGYYDTLECLHAPAGCIPNYPSNGPTFVDATMSSLELKSGYRRSFHPGRAPQDLNPQIHSKSSLESFAYVVVPMDPGRTGVRSFCGDSNGIVCSSPSALKVVEGACPPPPTCTPLY